MKAVTRDDADMSKLRITAYETINRLFENAPLDCLKQMNEFIQPFLSQLESSFNLNVCKAVERISVINKACEG